MNKNLVSAFLAGMIGVSTASAHMEAAIDLQERNITTFGMPKKTLALTFDDGPGSGTARILDVLKKYKVKATFFVVGKQMKAYPTLAKRIVDEGHLLANHSYTHPVMGGLTLERYRSNSKLLANELLDTHKEIAKYSPAKNFYYFRAPEGAWRQNYADILNVNPIIQQYIGPIHWSIGGAIQKDEKTKAILSAADWECWGTKKHPEFREVSTCLQGYLNQTRRLQGGVVLMHDIHVKTADMFERMLPILIKEGYKFVTIEEVEELKNYERVQPIEFFQKRRNLYK